MIVVQVLLILFQLGAAEVRTDFEASHPWYAGFVKDHYITGKDGCMAYTLADRRRARLEVYSQKKDNVHLRPTIQIVVDNYEFLTEAVLQVGRKRFRLTRASYPDAYGDVQALMARFDDRQEILDLLKAGSDVTVYFKTFRGRTFREATFSLRNSTPVIEAFERRCLGS